MTCLLRRARAALRAYFGPFEARLLPVYLREGLRDIGWHLAAPVRWFQ